MTALDRAEQIAARWRFGAFGGKEEMRDAIHRAIIEHSNDELERRRKAQQELEFADDSIRHAIELMECDFSESALMLLRNIRKAIKGEQA